jgi:mRNA-degrading endonuclease RelE of RelBE toxin-antitoxin system
MVEIIFTESFEKSIRKIRNTGLMQTIKKHIEKIKCDPEIGKPLRYDFVGERTVYVNKFRIVYSYNEDTIIFLVFDHRDDVYG